MKEINVQNDSDIKVNQDETIITSIPKSDKPAGKKGTYLIMGIVAGIALLTAIILLAVFIPRKNKDKRKSSRTFFNSNSTGTDEATTDIISTTEIVSDSNALITDLSTDVTTTEATSNTISVTTNVATTEASSDTANNLNLNLLFKKKNNGTNLRRYLEETEIVKIFGDNFNELNSENTNMKVNGINVEFNKSLSINPNEDTTVEIYITEDIKTFKEMFSGCESISEITLNNFETESEIETTSMFEGCSSLTDIKFENVNISNINDTSKMFLDCSSLYNIEIENFQTNKTKNISGMFSGCSSLNDTTFIEGLSTDNAESLDEMFSGCSEIKSLDLSNYDTSNVKNMSGMFKGMINLEEIEISSFNTENIEYMNEMFYNCSSIENLNLSNFNTENVISMEYMFANCINLKNLDVSSFNLTNCNNTNLMFENIANLTDLISNNEELMAIFVEDNYNQTIELIIEESESNLTENRRLQEDREIGESTQIFGDNFEELKPENTIIYVDGKKTPFNKYLYIKSKEKVKIVIKFSEKITTFREMFSGCTRLREVSLKNVETELVLETTSMFEGCTSLSGVKFENVGIYNIESTAKMFQKCSSLNLIEIENFQTNKTKNMSEMFSGCSSLNDTTFIEGLNTDSAESLDEMFSGCSGIKSLDLSNYNTSNAKNMSGMFKGMTNLKEIEISSFHTEKVEYMSEMFYNCSSIENLNLSNFNTENVITMESMFSSCLKLETIDLTSFSLKSCNSTEYMFSNTTRELMLSIEENEELMIRAGSSWSESDPKPDTGDDPKKNDTEKITKKPLDLLFIVDATGSMSGSIDAVKEQIIYISVELLKKKDMEIYNLSLGAVFYRDPIDAPYYDKHEIFDFDKNPLNFRIFVENIRADGGADTPEDWAGAFNLAKNLTWRNDSYKFIIHFADANAHGTYWDDYDRYPDEGIKNDEIITYFAKNNFNIAGFRVELSATKSFQRAQQIFRENNNFNYFIKDFDEYSVEKNYFLDLVYESFQNSLYTAVLYGFDISEEQGEINWDEVKGQNNTDFVIIRAGIGNKTDSQFEKNYEGAKKLGIPVGIYWYANSSNSDGAKKEAEICKNIIEGKKFEFPVYYVIEEQFIFNSGHQADIIDNFCNQLTPLNYSCALSSKYDKLTSRFDSVISDYQIWVNYYGDDMPVLDNDWGIWKYNDTGKIKGIEGNVNLDLAIVNYTKATLDNHYNGY